MVLYSWGCPDAERDPCSVGYWKGSYCGLITKSLKQHTQKYSSKIYKDKLCFPSYGSEIVTNWRKMAIFLPLLVWEIVAPWFVGVHKRIQAYEGTWFRINHRQMAQMLQSLNGWGHDEKNMRLPASYQQTAFSRADDSYLNVYNRRHLSHWLKSPFPHSGRSALDINQWLSVIVTLSP